MSYIKWNDDLSVKIPLIDEQHKKLISMINNFYKSFNDGKSDESLVILVSGLRDYTEFHFSAEEDLLSQHSFPGLTEQQTEHEGFLNKINDVHERMKNGKMVVSIEVTNYIKDWVSKHIMGTDKKYSKYLIDKGVK